jgi:RNA polymerase sigma-70 factor (ECF subfamily)
MPLSRKTAPSLVRAQQSKAEREATLIQWIARGDEAAFRLFHDATNGLLFGLLLRILGHTQTAEDVLSELYEEVRQKAARFGKQNERPLTWLIFIAHRRAIERLCCSLTTHGEISRRIDGKTKSTTVPDSVINITEQRRLIRAAMDSIPHLQQRMIELAFFAGMTRHEIAIELGESPEAVEDGLRYAILQLFSVFKSMGFSPEPATVTLQN